MPCEVIGHSQKHAKVPVAATDADQAGFTCPEFVPARAATSQTTKYTFRQLRLIQTTQWQCAC
eukprot:801752-Pleurochrysis_carterae.AAC.1